MLTKIFDLKSYFMNKRKLRLMRIMRGFRKANKNQKYRSISEIQKKFTTSNLGLTQKEFSPLIMGAGHTNSEIITRQYLLLRTGLLSLRAEILISEGLGGKKISYPLPKERRDILESEGFSVDHFKSSILWAGYILFMFAYGSYKIFYFLARGLICKKLKQDNSEKYCYFPTLDTSNFSKDNSSKLFLWYLNWPGKAKNISHIKYNVKSQARFLNENVKISYQSNPIPDLPDLASTLRYILWGAKAISISAMEMFKGHWWHALLLNQAALSGLVRCIPKQMMATQYMFHNSQWLYRPLWTYDAENGGSDIALYFYSTNCEPYQTSKDYKSCSLGYESMSWPKYLVWDTYQADFIKRAIGDRGKIEIVGPIDFTGGFCQLPSFEFPPIAVFDSTPFRSSRYCLLDDDDGFHTPFFVNQFLDQVSKGMKKNSFCMLWKRKRDIGRLAHPSYKRMQEYITGQELVFEIPSNVAASYLIESSVAVISSPYSSTAIIAKSMGKPCIYYDPSKLLWKGDRAAHGIPVIQGELELDHWLSSLRATLDF